MCVLPNFQSQDRLELSKVRNGKPAKSVPENSDLYVSACEVVENS
jgi:hypothetical protein